MLLKYEGDIQQSLEFIMKYVKTDDKNVVGLGFFTGCVVNNPRLENVITFMFLDVEIPTKTFCKLIRNIGGYNDQSCHAARQDSTCFCYE